MKSFALVVLALCVGAFASVNFTPHPLGCDFTITVKIEGEPGDSDDSLVPSATYRYFIHGTYFMIVAEAEPNQTGYSQFLARTDIRNPVTGEQGVFEVDVDGNGNEETCVTKMVDRDSVAEEIDVILFYFNETHTFENVTNGKFDGKDCKVYFMQHNDDRYYVYVDSDNYIIGFEDFAPKDHAIYHISYEMKAPLDLFVIDKNKYPGCLNASSVPPVVDTCQVNQVQPRELPCAYHIDWKSNYTDMSGTVLESVSNVMDARGSYLKLVVEVNESNSSSFTLLVVRSDMAQGENVTVFEVSSDYSNVCIGQMVPRSEIDKMIEQFHSIFFDPLVYEAKIEGEFMGTKCMYYYIYDKERDYVLIFALDDKNTILGGSANLAQEKIESVVIKYKFDAPLSSFVVDKSYAGCNDSAYTAPTFDPCKSPSGSGSSSSASIVKAGFAVVMTSLISALLSLF